MNKTTVYLPEDLKQSLRRMAAVSGCSEAELIREAIAAALHKWQIVARRASR
jgi:predicted transcriptional regulator